MRDLLPCPFCGDSPELSYRGNSHTKKRSITIFCPKCRVENTVGAIRNGFDWIEEKIKEKWNARIKPDKAENNLGGKIKE